MEKWEITFVTQTQQKCTLPAPSVMDAYLCDNKILADHRDNSPVCVHLRGKVWPALTGTAFKSLNCPPSSIYSVCLLCG